MAEEEVDWDDDWRVGGPSQPTETVENGNGNGNGNEKQSEDDVISLDGGDVDNEEVATADKNAQDGQTQTDQTEKDNQAS
ncbi:uncharacterized protein I206_101886 [Kwoniella pini CBS 10737]|uniref:Uncharacterized protein n=1 Tax=Kwoniella pini CBS 10737 TaxID=1296096 RepID=A0A1B9HVE7_9TREE|nr:uncharacterized protein I206_07023 [Kwoniella pini CBS 10737]OCF47245.1 hypothetical protein I206_07023 [Kwoniella pini CBS 10737]